MPIKTIIEPFRIKSIEAIVWRKREQIPGYEIIRQAKFLRHFSARLKPVAS
ncbi:MAG TPA: hypothetical protein VN943_07995 [Candidatus Acidoferrum sp.]|nr:hypothetical protein [Candidatus Acidoferrum sp.]